jgi:hypothetical protein
VHGQGQCHVVCTRNICHICTHMYPCSISTCIHDHSCSNRPNLISVQLTETTDSVPCSRVSTPHTCAAINLRSLVCEQFIARLACTRVRARGIGADCIGATCACGGALIHICKEVGLASGCYHQSSQAIRVLSFNHACPKYLAEDNCLAKRNFVRKWQ